MKRFLKWSGISLGIVVGAVLLLGAAVYGLSSSRMNKIYQIAPAAVIIPTDSSAIEEGRHIAHVRACVDCHGEDFGGSIFFDEAAVGRLAATNLTSGRGGVGASYTDEDWVRAIRHGVDPKGRPLLFMPSQEFNPIGDDDLGALIAYLKSVEPVDREFEPSSVGPVGRALFLSGQLPLLPVELIDHDAPRVDPPNRGVTPEYGEYLAVTCTGCHGTGYSGGRIPGTPPSWPEAANITPDEATGIGSWSEEDFEQALRRGVRPDGREMDPQFMPWSTFQHLTDDEVGALWAYLQTLPPREFGNR